ncbi:MAG: methyltransferase [Pseudomonadota bacterium]
MTQPETRLRQNAAIVTSLSLLLVLGACGESRTPDSALASAAAESPTVVEGVAIEAPLNEQESPSSQRLTQVLAAQSDGVKARFDARNPKETLLFFGVEPGMTVVEGDPGAGWYSNILMDYLGSEGSLYGAAYNLDVYRLFDYYTEEQLAELATWDQTWPGEMSARVPDGASTGAFFLGEAPAELDGTVDVVLFVRVLHNLVDFEEEGQHLSNTLADTYRMLKPGGVVGVVQHAGPEAYSDDWASGGNGYLKKSAVIAAMEAAGFAFEAESSVNLNPKDRPTEEEYVWRLPPTSDEVEDPELAASYAAIGESNRMTLKFLKPAP